MTPVDRLTCEEVFRRLDDYLDRELGPEETARMQAHLETCARCANEFAFERRVLDDVRDKVRRIATPADLRSRVAAAIARAAKEPPAD
jgi:anti-sigma factor (TIGR02949 family)